VRLIFVDTNYFGAIFSPRDPLHARAVAVATELREDSSVRYVTSLAVLGEFLTLVSKDAHTRSRAARFVDRVRRSVDTRVITGDETLFDGALELYRRRLDKSYSMIDCMSIVLCARLSIREVLTGDRDFAREGLQILL
jgi:predicted nucleic acid-binding protein